MTVMIRVQSLRGYRRLASDLGGDPSRLLRRAGIDPRTLDHLTAFIRFENMISLLERTAAELDCPDFGLRLADRQDLGILGVLAVAMRYSATVGDAGLCASRYLHVHSPGIAFNITPGEQPDQLMLAIDLCLKPPPPWPQTAEHAVGLAWHILRMLSEGRSHLLEVRFPHQPIGSLTEYEAHFPAPVLFGAPAAALLVPAEDLELPISDHHEELRARAADHLEAQLPSAGTPLEARVRGAVEALLGTGSSHYREVASALHMHPRTLQRRLREQGTSFEEIKDAVRRDLAERYLSQPDVSLSQVSALLDYGEQSALGRSCQRWFNTSPGQLRARLLAGPESGSPPISDEFAPV
jgi:AraC-like DNA-binding protein